MQSRCISEVQVLRLAGCDAPAGASEGQGINKGQAPLSTGQMPQGILARLKKNVPQSCWASLSPRGACRATVSGLESFCWSLLAVDLFKVSPKNSFPSQIFILLQESGRIQRSFSKIPQVKMRQSARNPPDNPPKSVSLSGLCPHCTCSF